jgi:ribonuclease P protein component
MLPLKHRLPLRTQQEFFAASRRLYGRYVTVFYMKTDIEIMRGVVVVPKKVSKKAVVRNKIKRQIRSLLSKCLITLKNYDLMVVVKKESVGVSFSELAQDFENTVVKL